MDEWRTPPSSAMRPDEQQAIDAAQRIDDLREQSVSLGDHVDIVQGEVAVLDPDTGESWGLGKYLRDMEARVIQHIHGEKWSQQVRAEIEVPAPKPMSSGIFVTVMPINGVSLPPREATCTVEDGRIIARAKWYDVPAGHYSVAHVYSVRGMSKTVHLDIPNADDHATVEAICDISWEPDA